MLLDHLARAICDLTSLHVVAISRKTDTCPVFVFSSISIRYTSGLARPLSVPTMLRGEVCL